MAVQTVDYFWEWEISLQSLPTDGGSDCSGGSGARHFDKNEV